MTIPAPDPQTFDWIKGALDGSMSTVLDQVRQAEQDADVRHLDSVPDNLHQINGSLRMVELEAAGSLAEDLEQLCKQLCAEVVEVDPEAGAGDMPGVAVLREGLEALRVYIDAIARQTPVSPLGLVDHINAVRRVTDQEPVSRFDLFHPPLTLLRPATIAVTDDKPETEDEPRRVPDDLRVRLVTQLRRKYRRALVSWLANRRKKGGSRHYLGKINDLLDHLLRISSLDISQQLWWVAGGFVEAVASGELDADKRIKSQFAQLDIEISRLEEESIAPIAVDPPDQLLRQMLFYIGAIEGAESERVRKIQNALNLNEWFDRDDSQYRKLVTASSGLGAVANAFDGDEFATLESAINDFFAGLSEQRQADPQTVIDALADLRSAADSKGPDELSSLLEHLEQALKQAATAPRELVSNQADIKIASALLFVRGSLEAPDAIDASWPLSVGSHIQELSALSDPSSADSERALRVRRIAQVEYQHARSAIAAQLHEVLGGLERILDSGGALDTDTVEATRQVSRVLDIAGDENAAAVAGLLSERLAAFGDANRSPQGDDLEHLAFAVAALDVAADHLARRGPEAENVLRTALDRLDDVALSDDDVDRLGSDDVATPDGGSIDQESDSEAEISWESTSGLIAELEYQRRQLLPGNHDGLRGLMESFAALAVADESGEEISKLAGMGKTICRNLLDQETGVDTEKRDFLGLLIRQLQELDSNATSTAPEQELDVSAWQQRVEALTGLGETAEPVVEQPVDEDDLLVADYDDVDAGLLQLDADLRRIFVEEFGTHLHTMRTGLNAYRQQEPDSAEARQSLQEIDDCVHTLSGNCRNLGFDSAADCAEAAAGRLITEEEGDRNAVMAQFAEALILLGQVRQETRASGQVSPALEKSLQQYVARAAEVGSNPDERGSGRQDDGDATQADELEINLQPEADDAPDQEEAVIASTAEDPRPASDGDSGEPNEQDSSAEIAEEADADGDADAYADGDADVIAAQGSDTIADTDIDEEIDEEIREIFIDESRSILNRINGHLVAWRESGADTGTLSGIRREFHTLKGSAAATGFTDISELSHRVESVLDKQPVDQVDALMDNRMLELLEEMHDGLAADLGIMQSEVKGHLPGLGQKLDALLGNEPDPETEVEEESEPASDDELESESVAEPDNESIALAGEESSTDSGTVIETDFAQQEELPPANADSDTGEESHREIRDKSGTEARAANDVLDTSDIAANQDSWMPDDRSVAQTAGGADEAAPGGMLRIGNSKLAELINASGEMSLVRIQLQDTLDATRMDLDVLRSSMSSMRAGLRDLELEADAQIRARPEQQSVDLDDDFDPLQLDRYSRLQAKSREVTELLEQLAKVERDLDNRAANLDGALRQQLHLGDQLQSGLMSARMVSMGEYLPRLRYLVRETSRQADKPVEFRFNGGDIQIDRQVIEAMLAPFEHMIRNAVAHGIEDRSLRKKAGKEESGTIALSLTQQGSELVVGFSDDGRGLDLDKLQARAVELGLVENASEATDIDLLQIISQPGYSTADSVTMESGRGVGMDVVYQAVRDLGGSMSLDNRPGEGTTFQFRLPVTLALTQALLVRVAGWRFAIRSRTIERLARIDIADITEEGGERTITVDDQPVTLYSVRERLGEPADTSGRSFLPVVLVRLADRLAAFEVDAFADSVNIVSKTSGKQLASIPEISGITILGDSSIVLILDPEAFVDRIQPLRTGPVEDTVQVASGQLRRVLVVDDSLVVRKVMQKDLEADGLEVATAVDGVNALEVLAHNQFDVALVDIEMPRMNGYELLEQLRSDPRYQALPVIIITSRSGDQHRQRAMSLGADGYITKPYDIVALDALMRQVTTAPRALH